MLNCKSIVARFFAFCFLFAVASSQSGAQDTDWRAYGSDKGSTRYAPLDQIAAGNVNDLEEVWRWKSPDADIEDLPEGVRVGAFKNTPLKVGDLLFVSTPLNQVVAVDACTGETVWVHNPEAYKRPGRGGTGYQHRGLAYWEDGDDQRIYIATKTRQLIALDATSGERVTGFGDDGWVNLAKGMGRKFIESQLSFSAPPVVCRDTIIVGSITPDEASNPNVPPGFVRGYDTRTGALKWVFHTIPQEGEFGNDTWADNSAAIMGATNVWTMLSADEELGYVYLPTATPVNDFYGGHRIGDNVFAESVVCLDADTGERVWHFQGVHHGLWDYDFPAAPILVDITVDGNPIKALAQVSKQGFTYVFDRATGEPVWPIEERAVPQTDVPGEVTSPTQPFPTKPPPFDRQGISEDDLIDFTPKLRADALAFIKDYKVGPLFTPPALVDENERGGTIQLPGAAGGANWGSAGVDPETGMLYVQSGTVPSLAGLIAPDPARSRFKYKRGGPWLLASPNGLPLTKPPYGRVTAIDLNKGEIAWQVPHGYGPENHPLLKDLDLPKLGAPSNSFLSAGGVCVTKSLVFYSHAQVARDASFSTEHMYVRAYDKANGDMLWETKTDAPPYGVPMSYMYGGKQYLVVATGGAGMPAELVAYALKD